MVAERRRAQCDFPREFHRALAAASTVHINLFGPHPIVVKGTPEQKARWAPRLIAGQDQVAFGFTEPDAGLDRSKIDVNRIAKMGRMAVDSNAVFIDGLFIPEADRIGENVQELPESY